VNKTEAEEDNKIKLADLPHIQLGAVKEGAHASDQKHWCDRQLYYVSNC
jgi:hypothetical protein